MVKDYTLFKSDSGWMLKQPGELNFVPIETNKVIQLVQTNFELWMVDAFKSYVYRATATIHPVGFDSIKVVIVARVRDGEVKFELDTNDGIFGKIKENLQLVTIEVDDER